MEVTPAPGEGGGGRDWLSRSELANLIPRLGRRSVNPYGRTRNSAGFRFFGGGTGSNKPQKSSLAGLFGPIFGGNSAFRFEGGRPEELTRGLLREKRPLEEYSPLTLPQDNVKMDTINYDDQGGNHLFSVLLKSC
jgi:hypothetical protein